MVAAIDTGLDFFRQVLSLRAYRQQILSADIANASTPGFKAVDLDFASALKATNPQGSGQGLVSAASVNNGRKWLVDDARQFTIGSAAEPETPARFVKYQTDSAVTLDGNSVDLDKEKVTAAENAVQYEAATTFTSQTIRMLMTAINGSGSQQSSGG
jgi:flagellar basal-body rod protein FlgB